MEAEQASRADEQLSCDVRSGGVVSDKVFTPLFDESARDEDPTVSVYVHQETCVFDQFA
jgi:hypothetical protein